MKILLKTKPYIAHLRKCYCSTHTHEPAKVSEEDRKPQGSTVDKNDVKNHEQSKNEWWDSTGVMGALHSMNMIRIPFIRDGLANVNHKLKDCSPSLHGLKILDVACGGGIVSEPLARIGADVTGIDASDQLIEVAKQHAAFDSSLSNRLEYINVTVEEHSEYHANTYDAVVASEILEHVTDPKLFLKSCIKSIKPGGSLFITTPNKTMASWLGTVIVAEYIIKIVPPGTHDWNQFVSPTETRRIIETEGCQTKLIHGMCYNPLTHSWNWTSATTFHYALHAQKKYDSTG